MRPQFGSRNKPAKLPRYSTSWACPMCQAICPTCHMHCHIHPQVTLAEGPIVPMLWRGLLPSLPHTPQLCYGLPVPSQATKANSPWLRGRCTGDTTNNSHRPSHRHLTWSGSPSVNPGPLYNTGCSYHEVTPETRRSHLDSLTEGNWSLSKYVFLFLASHRVTSEQIGNWMLVSVIHIGFGVTLGRLCHR